MKNIQTLTIYAIVGIVLLGAIALFATRGNGDENSHVYSESSLSAMENNFDFQTISMKDGDVSHQFELKNEGAESVKIEKAYTSCMCTVAYIIDSAGRKYGKFEMPGHGSTKTNIEVESGESVFVEAIFDPSAHGPSGVGLAQRSIYLETNSAKSPKLELSFRAMVTR